MRTTAFLTLLVAPLLALASQSERNPADALLDVLVWGTHVPIDPGAYDPVLKLELSKYLQRAMAYRSNTPVPPGLSAGEAEMVHNAQIGYERKLAAISDDPMAADMARAYVESLRPCYEWEGYHDCPEREARFADDYSATHPNSPFSEYLPLLAAHRWLCTAEAYDYERHPAEAERSRRAYEARLEAALRTKDLLLHTAAEQLAARRRCLPNP
jgi:hypothetical protein